MAAEKMTDLIKEMQSEGNSVGGIIECVVRGVCVGLGEPVFDKLEADLAKEDALLAAREPVRRGQSAQIELPFAPEPAAPTPRGRAR